MRNINEKHYEQFTPQERINLTISALVRADINEADRLWNTCPVYTYKTRDLEYNCRLMAITLINAKFFEQ